MVIRNDDRGTVAMSRLASEPFLHRDFASSAGVVIIDFLVRSVIMGGRKTEGIDAMMAFTAQQVAEWMVQEIRFKGILYQTEAISYVREHFGEEFVYVNENGNASLEKEVKKAFRKLHGGRIAWDRDGFMWAWT